MLWNDQPKLPLTSELKYTENWGRSFDSSEIKMTGVITEIQVLLVLRPSDSIASKVAFIVRKTYKENVTNIKLGPVAQIL